MFLGFGYWQNSIEPIELLWLYGLNQLPGKTPKIFKQKSLAI